ncbi:hypothetical protein [Modestobacter altitudinis]|uniref:hypothetical protein n=1 Tax=Modestobacter altitudinis TaxID=2213158 RepID=UPI00110CDC82|nr:hypothetical protein [Modestobacter altitudinis]
MKVIGNFVIFAAVLGIGVAVYFFVTGPAAVGWFLAVLVVLLLPSYLLVTRTPRQFGKRTGDHVAAQDPQSLAEGRGGIRVHRPAGYYVNAVRTYKILVDGEEVGSVRPGRSLDLQVEPGRHVVRGSLDWGGSQDLSVDVAAGETVMLAVLPGPPTAAFSKPNGVLELKLSST